MGQQMKTNSLKIFFLALISTFIFFFHSDNTKSCSFGFSADDYYSVFNPKLIKQPSLIPFFLSDLIFFPDEDSTLYSDKIQNLLEWKKYFNDRVESGDIEKLLYPTDKTDLKEILGYLEKNDFSLLKEKYKHNSLIEDIRKNRNIDVFRYFVFAKSAEPFIGDYYSWISETRDTTGMADLLYEGLKAYRTTNDKYLKLRYGFQCIRLAHYSFKFEDAIKYYDEFILPLKDESLISYWSLSLKAGALKRLKREVESNYLFSIVFDKCDTRKYTAAKDFRVSSDSSFNASIALCKNNDEKAAMWMLAAFKNAEIHFDAMKQIYAVSPKSKYLELILSREINLTEAQLFPDTYFYRASHLSYFPEKRSWYVPIHHNELLKIVTEYANAKNTLNPHLWYLCAGYLSTLLGNNNNAASFFYHAKEVWPRSDTTATQTLQLFEQMNSALSFYDLSFSDENRILPHFKWLYEQSKLPAEKDSYNSFVGEFYVPARNNGLSAFMYVRAKLAQVYASNGDFIKMHLCMGDSRFGYDLQQSPLNQPIDNLISFFEKPRKTEFEQFLEEIYTYSKSDLLGIKGTTLLSRHKFKEAVDVFNEVGGSITLYDDPFVININDCLSCDDRTDNNIYYTQKSFAERMLKLDSLANIYKQDASEYYYTMANGFYNITYYGNCWNATSYNRNFDYDKMYDESKDWEFYDCSTAREYYKKAYEHSDDREFKSKCVFMMSKCEQNDFYNNMYKLDFYRTNYDNMKQEYETNFKILLESYSDTQFYQQALKECKYFNNFVKGYKQ